MRKKFQKSTTGKVSFVEGKKGEDVAGSVEKPGNSSQVLGGNPRKVGNVVEG